MRYVLVLLLLAGCTSSRDVRLANGEMGHNISCGGAAQNYSDCLSKAGEICGAKGYSVVDAQGDAVPYAVAGGSFQAIRQSASGAAYGQSSSITTRNLFVQCKH